MAKQKPDVFREGLVVRSGSRAAQWVLNVQAPSKQPRPHARNTPGWDPLRPATWRRSIAPRGRGPQPPAA